MRKHVDEEDKTTALIQGPGSNYKSMAVLINESGLYALILSSCTQRRSALPLATEGTQEGIARRPKGKSTDPVCTQPT